MKLFLLVVLIAVAHCDLPVHCVKHQVVGRWKLFVEGPKLNGFGQLPCGHNVPDNARNSYEAHQKDFSSQQTLDVVLGDDYKVRGAGSNAVEGEWTMVYDEGFEIRHKNTKYFAFSKYEPQAGGAVSYCDQTLIGWYNNKDTGDRGCYRASKGEKVQSSESLEQVSVVQPEFMDEKAMKGLGFLQTSQKESVEFIGHEDIVEKLNSVKGTWTAKVYDHMTNMNFVELNKKLGMKKYYQGKREKQETVHTEEQVHAEKILLQTGGVGELPKNFNWKTKIGHTRQQEQCGSCYAIATMAMLSARLRIKGEDVTLSPQWSLNCNVYNQGCDGGYPYLVNKFAEEEYLVTEETQPYTGFDGDCDMSKLDGLNKVYAARDYKYLGNGYGRVDQSVIQREIMANGPVVLSFEPSFDFMYYEKGIYHSKAESKNFPEYEKVDHSVLCYGWGEEDGEKYWILQNSWGPQWGENGDFRMKRGVDESAIESMAESADPYVINRTGSSYVQEKQHKGHIFDNDFEQDDVDSIFSFNQIRQNIQ